MTYSLMLSKMADEGWPVVTPELARKWARATLGAVGYPLDEPRTSGDPFDALTTPHPDTWQDLDSELPHGTC